MKVQLKIAPQITQIEQMAEQLNVKLEGHSIKIPARLGKGFVRYFELPYNIQVHHYQYNLKTQIEVVSENTEEEGMYMLHLNLSNRALTKALGSTQHILSRAGKIGAVFYSPGYPSQGVNELNQEFEILFFAIPQATLHQFVDQLPVKALYDKKLFCIYTELSESLEKELRAVLKDANQGNTFLTKGALLQILGKLLQAFTERKYLPTAKLKLPDMQRQFKVKELLLSHIFGVPPTIASIASELHISPSKLKTDFKSLFGYSIYQYYLSKKMEVAKELLAQREGTIAEVGYRLGYTNIAQFSSQFKKHFGVPPSQLKR